LRKTKTKKTTEWKTVQHSLALLLLFSRLN